MGFTISGATAWRSILLAVAVLAVVMLVALGLGLPGLVVFNISVYVGVIGVALAGVVLMIRTKRMMAGAGAIVAAASALVALYWRPFPASVVWTAGLIAGVAMIASGSRDDSRPGAWPLLITRFAVGWAFFDNGQNDMVWLLGNNGFLTSATNDVKRGPLFFLDGPYLNFLNSAVIPGADTWTGLFLGAEFLFGLLVMVGLFSSIALVGTMWLSANIMLQKSFIAHGGYSDKTYFLVEAFNFVAGAGLSFSMDASLRRVFSGKLAATLLGAPDGAGGRTTGAPRPSPMPV
jgi:hypothetical protein